MHNYSRWLAYLGQVSATYFVRQVSDAMKMIVVVLTNTYLLSCCRSTQFNNGGVDYVYVYVCVCV